MSVQQFLRGRDLLVAVCEAQGIDPYAVQRIVIEADFRDVAIVHVQMIGSKRLLEVVRPRAGGLEVRVVE